MNVLLFDEDDLVAPGRVRVADRRHRHVREVLRAKPGDALAVGRIGGRLGQGTLVVLDAHALELEVALEREPPAKLPVTLALALPRPPSLRKVLQQATALGVPRFVLFASARVEKSYWQSTGLEPERLRDQLLLGLEQAGDTVLPEIAFARRFRPFVEDELARLARSARILVAHPGSEASLDARADARTVLVIGPEGGLQDHELARLDAVGALRVGLGPRVLRVETAAVALLARLAG
ncbi:MAG: 16S rRNA (uracil(1498)-N(3))-methyltransferase [Myxococcota bacterium]